MFSVLTIVNVDLSISKFSFFEEDSLFLILVYIFLRKKRRKRNGPAEQKKKASIGRRAMSLYGLQSNMYQTGSKLNCRNVGYLGNVRFRTTTAMPPFCIAVSIATAITFTENLITMFLFCYSKLILN